MRKFLTFFMFFLLAGVATVAVFHLMPKDSPAVNIPDSYDEELYQSFLSAEARGDYVAMNNAHGLNMSKTGIDFLDYDYDETHGGIIYTYSYSVPANSTEDPVEGKLYVVSPDLDRDAQTVDENDYFAVDRRFAKDPEFVVISSYRADRNPIIRELCQLLLDHEAAYPTDWDRTLESMVEEWEIHNMAYSMNYKTDHSADVNLNNADENTDWLRRAMEALG